MQKTYVLECCVDSVESALAAARGGATRLELCSSLITGGLSPSIALFREIRRNCNLPIHVLLRPRFGDFLYTEYEFAVLLEEVRLFQIEGADGLVIGCLTPDGALDIPHMEKLIVQANGTRITLHRAFDMCSNPIEGLNAAKSLGIHTILTAGQQNACLTGKPLIEKLLQQADDIEILIGGGVNATVIETFLKDTPACAFHMSGKKVLTSNMQYRNPSVSMGTASLDEYSIWQTDENQIRAAEEALLRHFA